MRPLLALSLLACTRSPEETGETGDSEDTGDSGVPAAVLVPEVAEAEDLDADPDVVSVVLTAAPYDGDGPWIWAYNDQVPGPTLRAKVGDRLQVELHNELPDPTTVHWHGLHLPFDMDGVTWMHDPVDPGEVATYAFDLDRAGTFWYHPHFDSAAQVDLGLFGVLVVEDPADPAVDVERVLVFDADDMEHDTDENAVYHGLSDRDAEWSVNGVVGGELHLDGGNVARLRVLNASTTRPIQLQWPGSRQIGSDQGLLAAPILDAPVLLAPGDRADFEWDVGPAGAVVEALPYSVFGATPGDPKAVMALVGTATPAPAPLDWPFDGAAPSADPGYTDVTYVFQGDTNGEEWLINGEAFPDVTIHELPFGADAVIEVRNLSATEHPFHLHGLFFEVLSVDGVVPSSRLVEDTWNVPIQGRVRLRVLADNPGDWMAHCHLLPHAEGGMMTVLRVNEP